MATTSQTYPSTSLIPTSTSPSYSSNPAPTNDLGGDDLGNILTTSGSPPLIVAFLAIGLFVVAMVGVFGWRKLSQRRGLDPQPVRTNRRKSVALGKKPVLWDLWARVPGTGNASINIEDTRWENITPFSAVLTFSVPPRSHPRRSNLSNRISISITYRSEYSNSFCRPSGDFIYLSCLSRRHQRHLLCQRSRSRKRPNHVHRMNSSGERHPHSTFLSSLPCLPRGLLAVKRLRETQTWRATRWENIVSVPCKCFGAKEDDYTDGSSGGPRSGV